MQLSEAEWRVMDVIWRRYPASVRDVHEALADETGWAYSTVKTMCARLVEKRVLAASKQGNSSLVTPRITRDDARQTAVGSLLQRAFAGAASGLMQHLLGEGRLSTKERRELRELLDQESARERPKGKS
jgi:BlaI family penicillinase repressor